MRLAGILSSFILLGGCANEVGDLGCDEIVGKAKELSQAQDTKITALANVMETSRSEAEVRCRAEARWSDNAATPVYVRAYEESENRMVAYQATPFE